MVEQRRGRPSQWDSQQAAPPIENMEPIPGAWPARPAQRARQPDHSDQQYYRQAPAAPRAQAPATVTLSDEEFNKIKTITREVFGQKEANQRKETELQEKEDALRKGTTLLLEQRDAIARKEDGLKARETELRTIAGELEKQAKKISEREGSLAQQRNLFSEEEARRRKFSEGFRAREGALVQKEGAIRTLEKDLKMREQAVLGMEMDIKECPYCNVRYEFEGITDMMDEVRAFGLDLTELDKKYAKAQEHMKREAYDQALESARAILKDLRGLREDVLAKGVQYVVVSAANTVAQARARGVEITEAERHLAQARAAMAKNDFRTAEQYAKEADYIARDLMREQSSAPEPSAIAPGPESPAPPMSPLEPTPLLPAAAAPKVQRRVAAQPRSEDPQQQRLEAPPPQEYGAPDTGPRYVPAPAPRYESVGDAGPHYESVPQPQEEPAPDYDQYDRQYQAPAEEAPPPAPDEPKKYRCQNCYAQFTIGIAQRPVKVNCPSCGTTMIIRD